MLIAAGSGITGIATPGILTNQYAYQDFDLPLNETCTDNKFVDGSKLSKACESGSDRAQDVVSLFEIVMNLMVLVTSPMLGYWTDIYGRKTFLLAGIFLTCPIAFSLMIVENNPDITPLVYFFSYTLQGLIFTLPVLLSALSDSVPIQHRAPAFGILLAVLMATVSSMSVASAFLSDRTCCFLSVLFNAVGFVFAVFCVPETLTEATRLTSRLKADEKAQLPGSVPRLLQPFVDLKILNRNSLFRYLAILVIFSSMVAEGSQVLMLYYLQDNFDFKSTDSAEFMVSIGLMSMLAQGLLLKPLNDRIGERRVLIFAMSVGVLHCFFYGFAKNKMLIFVGGALVSFTFFSFPTISAIKANNADENEQGIVQGAIYSCKSFASAIGPFTFRFAAENLQVDWMPNIGASMWLVAAVLYAISVVFCYLMPEELANSKVALAKKKNLEEEGLAGMADKLLNVT